MLRFELSCYVMFMLNVSSENVLLLCSLGVVVA